MEYGYFDHAAREYVITRPDTPTPWINYLGGNGFGGIISNTGGGLCFDGVPSNRRVNGRSSITSPSFVRGGICISAMRKQVSTGRPPGSR